MCIAKNTLGGSRATRISRVPREEKAASKDSWRSLCILCCRIYQWKSNSNSTRHCVLRWRGHGWIRVPSALHSTFCPSALNQDALRSNTPHMETESAQPLAALCWRNERRSYPILLQAPRTKDTAGRPLNWFKIYFTPDGFHIRPFHSYDSSWGCCSRLFRRPLSPRLWSPKLSLSTETTLFREHREDTFPVASFQFFVICNLHGFY